MSAHTPGPWEVKPEECDRPYIRVRGTRLGGRFKVCNVLTPVYEGVHKREADETRANARLIAAAPELLAALQVFAERNSSEEFITITVKTAHVDKARAAIAKATGSPA